METEIAMSAQGPTELLAFLEEHGFLAPTQVVEVGAGNPTRYADARALAGHLVERGWLTAYQANQLLQGRGGNLVLGPYRLLDRLGEGGMAQVFKAHHLSMDRVVALKIIPRERLSSSVVVTRFYREVRAVARLSHPNIVIAFDASQIGETHFLVMEFVEGIDLAKLVQQSGPLPISNACDYIRQAALGLQHAHEKGLVHRDIKPGNLMVTRPSPAEPPVIKILDFGLARFESENTQGTRLTQLGNIIGTVDYIAPEQAENAQTADIRADLYSLGCTLFYLLTGQPPFLGKDTVERIGARLGAVPSVRQGRREVPRDLEVVIARMMARHPAHRYQTPAEVAQALHAFAVPAKMGSARPKRAKVRPRVPPHPGNKERARTAPPPSIPTAPTVEEDSIFALTVAPESGDTARVRRRRGVGSVPYGCLAIGAFTVLLSAVLFLGWFVLVIDTPHQSDSTDPLTLLAPASAPDQPNAPDNPLVPPRPMLPTPPADRLPPGYTPPEQGRSRGERPLVPGDLQKPADRLPPGYTPPDQGRPRADRPLLPADLQKLVNQAIDRGVEHLKKNQLAFGAWDNRYTTALAALPGLTLLECGVPSSDPRIQKAARFVRDRVPYHNSDKTTYELSLALLFLDRLGEAKDKPLIQAIALRLVAGQLADGGWTYRLPMLPPDDENKLLRFLEQTRPAPRAVDRAVQKPGDLPPRLRRLPVAAHAAGKKAAANPLIQGVADNSNTQFATLALWAARRHDLPLERSLDLLARHFRKTQLSSGAWKYRPGWANDTPAMTGVGLLGLAVGHGLDVDKKTVKDAQIDKGLKALGKAIGKPLGADFLPQLRKNGKGQLVRAGRPQSPINLYLLWTVERVGVLYRVREMDGKDWYLWGVEQLLPSQAEDGSWFAGGYPGSTQPIDTCFALLFLKRANLTKDLTTRLEFVVEGRPPAVPGGSRE
jgi:serine/threonine protein kinase